MSLAACDQGAPAAEAAEVRIEKKIEVLKEGERKAAVHTPVFQGIADPAVLAALHESIASGVRDATRLLA